ncbi:hypothetical protein [Salinibacterium sp. ZJ70]|uniref:hypothetical protein n=1 Tax=Salinibacterium sp. ZJ70 TaxID=2708084 RepID=UPI00141F5F9E|nr:hypothetical protein [Salinibacterium sp. ZJ70]
MSDDASPREFRPDWSRFHRRLWRRWAMLLPLTLLIMVLAVGPQVGFLFVAIGLPMVVGGLVALLYFSRARVWFEGPVLRIRGALRTRSWSTSDVGNLVFVPQPGLPGKKMPATLYGVTTQAERLFWLSGDLWDREDQDAIAALIGAPIHEVPAGLTPKEIAERFPGTLGWTALKPWLFALVIAACALALMVTVSVIITVVLLATGQLTLPAS